MNNKKAELKRSYKENPPLAGIFKITNKTNGKIYIDKGLNVRGILNRHEFQLKNGSHKNSELQRDWEKFGAENFTLDIIDHLKPSANPSIDINDELAELESIWLNELAPYDTKGYNTPAKK